MEVRGTQNIHSLDGTTPSCDCWLILFQSRLDSQGLNNSTSIFSDLHAKHSFFSPVFQPSLGANWPSLDPGPEPPFSVWGTSTLGFSSSALDSVSLGRAGPRGGPTAFEAVKTNVAWRWGCTPEVVCTIERMV